MYLDPFKLTDITQRNLQLMTLKLTIDEKQKV